MRQGFETKIAKNTFSLSTFLFNLDTIYNSLIQTIRVNIKNRKSQNNLKTSFPYIFSLFKYSVPNRLHIYICFEMGHRELNCRKLFGAHFLFVIAFISFSYYLFVYEYLIRLKPSYFLPAMIVFHIVFGMLLWSMIRSICSDPGRVPIYWGFFLDEKETKKRRYCLLCHSFKPQRCHHCSTCQRCVLNMDHHCPWISNCVGFSNRKFFMLFLFYICLTTIVAIAFMAPMFVQEVINAIHTPKYLLNAHVLTRLLGFLLLAAFGVIIAMFFKFHVELVLRNSSTLENLEKVRNPEVAEAKNLFDMGNYENWVQVFGTNAMLWPFPVFGESGKPRGDGVDWRKNDGSN